MIINHSREFIFVHVPKSAGTSVCDVLRPHSTYRDLELGGTKLGEIHQDEFRKRFGLDKHSTATEISAVVGEAVWTAYHSFGVVRNPYARAHSAYHYLRRWWDKKKHGRLAFVQHMPEFRQFALSPDLKKLHRLLGSQTEWLCDAEGRILVNSIAHVESLGTDLRRIFASIPGLAKGTLPASSPPNRNGSAADAPALRQILQDEPAVERAIYQAYRDDFEVFGYPRFNAEMAADPFGDVLGANALGASTDSADNHAGSATIHAADQSIHT